MEAAYMLVHQEPYHPRMVGSAPNSPAPRPRKRTSAATKPTFVMKNGRKYYNDEKTSYCLPCDIKELSRQTLWHELSREIFGGYTCVDFKTEKIPGKVLEVGCGSGIWSACLADEFAKMGHPNVEFTGMDIVESQTDMTGVNFKFVKHDVLSYPLPFEDATFDFVFSRDIALCVPAKNMYTGIISECLRVLKPGGFCEIQCNDYVIRTLQRPSYPYQLKSSAYEITPTTQFNPTSENPYIQQWNDRITKALVKRDLPPVPCTLMGPSLVMEDGIVGLQNKRVALPLDAVWWESPNADTQSESSSSISSKRRSMCDSSVESFSGAPKQNRKRGGSSASSYHHHLYSNRGSSTSTESNYASPLTDEERAVRQLAKLTFAQLIEALEPVLRDANNIDLNEWDSWYRDLMWNWFEGQGLRGGECLEFGSWWARKKL